MSVTNREKVSTGRPAAYRAAVHHRKVGKMCATTGMLSTTPKPSRKISRIAAAQLGVRCLKRK
jgi:hypothetical protein